MSIEISVFSLYKKIIKNYYKHNNFIIFKKPYDKKIFFYSHYDRNSIIGNFFLIQNFNQDYTIKIYPKQIYHVNIQGFYKKQNFHSSFWEENSSFLTYSYRYQNLIEKAIRNIKKGFFKKVVLSRYLKISFRNFHFKNTFIKLICTYPNALISFWYDFRHGFWMGCSPELLMKCYNNKLKVSSLAGTTWEKNKWTKKEIEEHKIVTRYILDILKSYEGAIYIKNTKTIKIGYLKHLETPIHFLFDDKPDYYDVLNRLYPTPSICGFPKKESLDFIHKNEGYKRNFYTGYIGTVNQNSMELYLNLRCVRIKKDKKEITLYAGSGITIDSNIHQEYIETENKIKSILSQLIFK
ncbi:Salicylate biosynthesis isochorismate synthase [Blattabacterium sp. (Nauphoeta cinerea)]|uniref:chorismate-binding protein n=1 Tax=Blattabacterium sp. (Nauphoeta cinerea) TaxID=1316444 RepID=UPI0003B0F0DE|nr:chorismate-binding protein [Blattabacterium sp. (Nauphoeta cinerea)]AGW85962.1 Salicylate biosynthesis isochorismate synthase [Blattabacterium sp. (Nauphoeta cinerea)]